MGEWEKALEMHKTQAEPSEAANDEHCLASQMRCLEALGYWHELTAVSEQILGGAVVDPRDQRHADLEKRQKIAQMAARGWWAMGEFQFRL